MIEYYIVTATEKFFISAIISDPIKTALMLNSVETFLKKQAFTVFQLLGL